MFRTYLSVCLAVLGLLFASSVRAGGGYPMMYCDDATNPATCYYVTSSVGAPTTICDAAGNCITLSALEASFLESVIGLPVKGAMYGWDGIDWQRILVGTDGRVYMSMDQIGGVTVNVNGGVIDTGTQTTTLATDDPAVVDLAAIEVLLTSIDAWDLDTSFVDGMNLDAPQVKTAAVIFGYNGATLDMARVGASKELQVNDIATRPGEDAANDYRKTAKYYSEGYSPAKTTTTSVGTAESTVLTSTEILNYPNVCVYLENDDGVDPFTDADVYVSPDGSSWVDLAWSSCDTLAHGEVCVYCLSNHAYRYIKVGVKAADANQVDVDAWLTANRN